MANSITTLIALAALGAATTATATAQTAGQAAPAQASAPAASTLPAAPDQSAPAQASAPAVSTPPAAPDQAASAAGPDTAPSATVGYIQHNNTPVYSDMTAGKAAFALSGAVVAMINGRQIVKDYKIDDPSNRVAVEIAKSYAAAHGYTLAAAPIMVGKPREELKAEEIKPEDASKAVKADPSKEAENDEAASDAPKEKIDYQGARYVVDVRLGLFETIYFPFDWTHFGLFLGDYARIIDTTDNHVVAKARCFIKSKKTPESPSHDKMLAENAAVLKKMIADASDECVAKLKTDLKL